MSMTFHVDEQATSFSIFDYDGRKEVSVCFSQDTILTSKSAWTSAPKCSAKSSQRWRVTMNEELTLAYDLKHQLEVMPVEHKDNYMVDGFETQLSAYDRVLLLIAYLERMNNGRR